jgi:hypothetical protein
LPGDGCDLHCVASQYLTNKIRHFSYFRLFHSEQQEPAHSEWLLPFGSRAREHNACGLPIASGLLCAWHSGWLVILPVKLNRFRCNPASISLKGKVVDLRGDPSLPSAAITRSGLELLSVLPPVEQDSQLPEAIKIYFVEQGWEGVTLESTKKPPCMAEVDLAPPPVGA